MKLSGVIDGILTCVCLCASGCVGGDAPSDPFAVSDDAGSGKKPTNGDAGTASVKAGSKESHYPLVDGASWTFHHENPTKEPWDEVDTLVATTYKDEPAFILNDQEDAQGEQTASTLIVDGTGVYRVYKEVRVNDQLALKVTYDPGFLRYDEAWTSDGFSATLDDGWRQECVFTSSASKCAAGATKPGSTTHVFRVISTSEKVTVPAGTFETVVIERENPGDRETKRFWFAKGVGKVRELDLQSSATEELSAYEIP